MRDDNIDDDGDDRQLLLSNNNLTHDSSEQDFVEKHQSSKKYNLIKPLSNDPDLENNPRSDVPLTEDGTETFWPFVRTTLNLAWKIALGMVSFKRVVSL
jgi:hypothetical protein